MKEILYEDFTLLVDGKNAFPAIISEIEKAEKSLEINMFIWRDDEIGNRLAECVLRAADRGVDVFCSVDRYGSIFEHAEEAKKSFFHKSTSLTEKIKIKSLQFFYPENRSKTLICDEESGRDSVTAYSTGREMYREPLGKIADTRFCRAVRGYLCERTVSVHTRYVYDISARFDHVLCKDLTYKERGGNIEIKDKF